MSRPEGPDDERDHPADRDKAVSRTGVQDDEPGEQQAHADDGDNGDGEILRNGFHTFLRLARTLQQGRVLGLKTPVTDPVISAPRNPTGDPRLTARPLGGRGGVNRPARSWSWLRRDSRMRSPRPVPTVHTGGGIGRVLPRIAARLVCPACPLFAHTCPHNCLIECESS